jgi:hypothetical protein
MPGMRTGRHLIRASLLLLASCVLLGSQVQGPDAARDIAVSPAGADDNPGTAARPLRTLQRALDIAQPGSVIALAPGMYDPVETRRAGAAGAPIVIRGGESGRDAAARFRTVIRGSRIVL